MVPSMSRNTRPKRKAAQRQLSYAYFECSDDDEEVFNLEPSDDEDFIELSDAEVHENSEPDEEEISDSFSIGTNLAIATAAAKVHNRNKWQYVDDNGKFQDYCFADSKLIQLAFAKGTKLLVTDKFSFNYTGKKIHQIDFAACTQTNLLTKKVRKIVQVQPKGSSRTTISKTSVSRQISPAKKKVRLASSSTQQSNTGTFDVFISMVSKLEHTRSKQQGIEIVENALDELSRQDGFLLVKLALPNKTIDSRSYNMKYRKTVKFLATLLGFREAEVQSKLDETGDVGEMAEYFHTHEDSLITPNQTSKLTLQSVDTWLSKLAAVSQEDQQMDLLSEILSLSTATQTKWVFRMIKKDLKTGFGAPVVLGALGLNAYNSFQNCADLRKIYDSYSGVTPTTTQCGGSSTKLLTVAKGKTSTTTGSSSAFGMSLMTPIKPMLASPLKNDFKKALAKGNMLVEIKYDGERVQVHKNGDQFKFFSRSLKPVAPHKVALFEKHIPNAFKQGESLVLDAEVLLVDTLTGSPLPFGTLGVNKKQGFKDASVCLFVFDILFINGKSLLDEPMINRRQLLEKHVTQVPNKVQLSELIHIDLKQDSHAIAEAKLNTLMQKCMDENLEGLMIKPATSVYGPGKRHWFKVKKDYLKDGSMADTADLVVLGANFGTGKLGGQLAVYLMGTFDAATQRWKTVCKVGNGFTDIQIQNFHKKFTKTMTQIVQRDRQMFPSWAKSSLDLHNQHIPDYIVSDPFQAPVWEVTGAEFSASDKHTANGISIRFPRVTRERNDKCPKTATSLQELDHLYKESKKVVVSKGGSFGVKMPILKSTMF